MPKIVAPVVIQPAGAKNKTAVPIAPPTPPPEPTYYTIYPFN
jgi:hypothetical protein